MSASVFNRLMTVIVMGIIGYCLIFKVESLTGEELAGNGIIMAIVISGVPLNLFAEKIVDGLRAWRGQEDK